MDSTGSDRSGEGTRGEAVKVRTDILLCVCAQMQRMLFVPTPRSPAPTPCSLCQVNESCWDKHFQVMASFIPSERERGKSRCQDTTVLHAGMFFIMRETENSLATISLGIISYVNITKPG